MGLFHQLKRDKLSGLKINCRIKERIHGYFIL